MPAAESLLPRNDAGSGAETPPRRIAHLDMDAFFASVELLRYPQLRGLPLVVGGRRAPAPYRNAAGAYEFARLKDYAGRGVVTTSTYEARALGVFSAMPMMKAARLAPDAILLPADFDAYRYYSTVFKSAVTDVVPAIESRSIDEIYIDLTGHPEPSVVLASRIKRAVNDATGLSCSIAIAPNKLLAKLGSELDKPDGLTILQQQDVPTRIWLLNVGKVNGIGPKATRKLHSLGILTVGDLARAEPSLLQANFSARYSLWLRQCAYGIDDRPVRTVAEPRSISRETTFERDLHPRDDRVELTRIFTALCEQVAEDLARKGYWSRSIGVKLRYDDFRVRTRNLTLPSPVRDARSIRRAAGECLKRVPLEQRLRLLGVRCAGLVPEQSVQRQDDGSLQSELPL